MIEKLRDYLQTQKLDAILITRTDSFLGEHFPPESKTLQQATGFSGSAGMAIITLDQAVLFVDSRYTAQAKIESEFDVFEVPTQTTPTDWMVQNLSGKVIGYNPWHRSVMWMNYVSDKKLQFQEISWQDWQSLFSPQSSELAPDFDYDEIYCGESVQSKIEKVVACLKQHQLDAYIFTAPDSVSYLLNKRSLSVQEYPVIFERWIVFSDGTYCEVPKDVSALAGKKIGMDMALTPVGVFRKIKAVAQIEHLPDPIGAMKAIKNTTEQNNIRQACLFESTILCRFLAWVENNKKAIDELACVEKLKELRATSPLYRGDSFDTIAAVGAHAALAHYQSSPKTNIPVTSAPLLLVDTGGNYLNGTTDMTRTICVGEPTDLMKKRYTQVLKGHIALALTKVKSGDLPTKLDQNARQYLRADGVDYGHSTGHGIGMYLAVHEYPPTIYEKSTTPLSSGMLFSNEPAFYDEENGFGIRLENMILTLPGPDNSLILENLLWVPFDGRLVDFDLLTEAEKEWLTAYHKAIADRILPSLTPSERSTLQPLLDFFA